MVFTESPSAKSMPLHLACEAAQNPGPLRPTTSEFPLPVADPGTAVAMTSRAGGRSKRRRRLDDDLRAAAGVEQRRRFARYLPDAALDGEAETVPEAEVH